MSHTPVTAAPQVLTDPEEIKLIFRWRQYQKWVKSLPPTLLQPPKAIRNPNCTALEHIPQNKSK